MDLDLSQEQQEFRKTVEAFVDDVIRPNAERWDEEHESLFGRRPSDGTDLSSTRVVGPPAPG